MTYKLESANLPYVSVVIPCYKAENNVIQAINSVYSQEDVNTKVIVVEDGFFDNTKYTVMSYDKNIEYIQLYKNHGATKARNIGLNAVDTEYVMFLDSDDYLEGPLLKGLVYALQNSNASVAFGPLKKFYEYSNKEKLSYPPINETGFDVIKRWLCGNSGPGTCSILWRTSEIKRIGAWNEDFHINQDGELIIRAFLNGCTVTQSYEGYGVYRFQNANSLSSNVTKFTLQCDEHLVNYVFSNALLYNKHYELLNALNNFRLNVAIKSYRHNINDIGKAWEKRWKDNGGKFAYFGRSFFSKLVSFLIYQTLGLQKGEKIRIFIKKIFLRR